MKKLCLILVGLLIASAAALHLGYDAANDQLTDLTMEGYTRRDGDGTLREVHSLADFGWAYASPSGNFLLLAEFQNEAFPTVADLRLLDAAGDEVWSKGNRGFASAVLADDGRTALIEYFGEGPQAPAVVSLLDPSGELVMEIEARPLGECRFSADGKLLAVNIAGVELAVFETTSGEQIASLPSGLVFTLGPEASFVLWAEADRVIRHQLGERSTLFIETGVEVPRWFSNPEADGDFALAGMDDVFCLCDGVEYYAELPEGHSIASLDASADHRILALGSYLLGEDEGAVWLLDEELVVVRSWTLYQEDLGGPWPQVLLTPERLWVKTAAGLTSFDREEER
ncbi:MAG: hypothetical protein GF403_04060 [Candidatus Coatesbacteria bacterium]|nr:hypothetical protein [Candidatus Coatesbacteria bacterium]